MKSQRREGALIGSPEDFGKFIAPFTTPNFARRLADVVGEDEVEIQAQLKVYLSEMRFGYRFLADRLPKGRLRILEVGAGLGLLSIYLHRQGHEVIALEPAAPAFGIFEATRKEIWSFIGENCPKLEEQGAEELNPEIVGTFDFIFSINVMEHISKLERAFAAIASVLRPGGMWLNSCPNYFFPYEPHYAVPIVPFAPRFSRRLHARRIDPSPGTWDTLNFIDWLKVRKLAAVNGLDISFEKSTLHSSLARIGEDADFRARHKGGIAVRLYGFMDRMGIIGVTRYVPPVLATPMIFRLVRRT